MRVAPPSRQERELFSWKDSVSWTRVRGSKASVYTSKRDGQRLCVWQSYPFAPLAILLQLNGHSFTRLTGIIVDGTREFGNGCSVCRCGAGKSERRFPPGAPGQRAQPSRG